MVTKKWFLTNGYQKMVPNKWLPNNYSKQMIVNRINTLIGFPLIESNLSIPFVQAIVRSRKTLKEMVTKKWFLTNGYQIIIPNK